MMTRIVDVLVASTLCLASGAALARASDDTQKAITDYQSLAGALSAQPANPKHPAEVKAMGKLADALEALGPDCQRCSSAATAIRADAKRIARSSRRAVHSDWTHDALTNAVEALGTIGDQSRKGEGPQADRIAIARASIDKIDPHTHFLAQREVIDQAFRDVGDALAAAGERSRENVAGRDQSSTVDQEKAPEEVPPPQTTIINNPPPVVVTAPPPQHKPWMSTQIAISVGGGYASFGAKGLRDITQNGGEWDFRLLLGAHSPVGVELGYVGTANQLNGRMAGVDPNGIITSNAFEGTLRLATPPNRHIPLQLYGFAGAGVNSFDLVNESFNNGAIRNQDTTFVLPAGGGLQFNVGPHFTVDGRFTYRAMFDEDLLGRDHNADMYTATARAGYVF
jgi:hypothetical protein